MIPQTGHVLVSHNEQADPGAWFVIYSDDEGVLAFDLTSEHPDVGYEGFRKALQFEDINPLTEKIVLLGGPERLNDGLIILHETQAATEDSTIINDVFSFLSYTYVLLPGKPPVLTTPDNKPTQIRLKKTSNFLVAMGFRIFDTKLLTEQIKEGNWIALPASVETIFHTSRHDRRAKILRQMN